MASCTSNEEATTIVQGDLQQPTVTWPLSSNLASHVDGINDFALDALRLVDEASGGKDIIISPLSLVYTLAIAADGAAGPTRNEITATLGFAPGNAHSLASLCASLIRHYDDDGGVLNAANAMFVRHGLRVGDDFRTRLVDCYDAMVEEADFSSAEAMEEINRWVATQTDGMIPRLEGGVDASTAICLLSAVSMKAKWEKPFTTSLTRNSRFLKADGTAAVWLPTMQHTDMMAYASTKDAQFLELPYKGGRYAMTICLPHSTRRPLEALKGTTGSGLLRQCLDMDPTLVNACVPRFATSCQKDLSAALSDMGISSALDPTKAEFPHIASKGGIFLSTLLQKAVINVNEEGTVAAAATVIGGETSTGDAVTPVRFTADHPFLYIITDKQASVIIFAGIYYGDTAD